MLTQTVNHLAQVNCVLFFIYFFFACRKNLHWPKVIGLFFVSMNCNQIFQSSMAPNNEVYIIVILLLYLFCILLFCVYVRAFQYISIYRRANIKCLSTIWSRRAPCVCKHLFLCWITMFYCTNCCLLYLANEVTGKQKKWVLSSADKACFIRNRL